MSASATRKPTISEALEDLASRLATAHSVVSITAAALDHGETNLELHAADALKPAVESLDDILSNLTALRFDVQPRRRLSKRARLLLSVPEQRP